jgi:hypothetical protein
MACLLPTVFDQPCALFVLLPAGTKFPPIEKNWQRNGHIFQEAAEHVAKGGNVGVMAGNGHIGLDQDDPSAFIGLELPNTTTWETRPGRLGMRFTCTDRTPELLAKYGKKADHAQFKLYKNGKSVGEVKLERTYQVIPPSWKMLEPDSEGQRADYRMIQDIPPTPISLAKLLEDLQGLGITFSTRTNVDAENLSKPEVSSNVIDANKGDVGFAATSLDDIAKEVDKQEIERIKKYAEAALKSEIELLRNAEEGNRNNQLNDSAFKLAQLAEAGLLDNKATAKALYATAKSIGLDHREIIATIKSAWMAGIRNPRKVPNASKEWQSIPSSQSELGVLNSIDVDDRLLQEIAEEALWALINHNRPPRIFSRAGSLVRLHKNEILVIEPLSVDALKNALARAAGFNKKQGKESINVSPPNEVVRDILAMDDWPGIPEIKRIIEIPVIRPDGSILSQAGYDESTNIYLDPVIDLKRLVIPEILSQKDAVESAQFILNEIFADFPFDNNASRANTLALLLSVVVRPMIKSNIPLFILEKPQAGTGASLIADIISTITTGKPASMWGMPETDDEWRKAITSALVDGSPLIVIDNVVGQLKSASLTRALTSKIWRDRQLGKNKMLDLPQEAVWIATGNNIQIGGDIARRTVRVRLDAACARPWMRTGFKHPDLLDWIKDNHGLIISRLLIISRAWVLAGKPPGNVRLGSFSEWAKVISGILEFAGVKDFMGNASELYDDMDTDVQQWDAFLEEWAALHADHPITAGQLRDELLSDYPIYHTFQDSMPDDVAKAVGKDYRASLSLGVVLRKHLDQVYPSGRKLTQVKDAHTKAGLWKVAGSPENQDQADCHRLAGSAGSCSLTPEIPEFSHLEGDGDTTRTTRRSATVAVQEEVKLPAYNQSDNRISGTDTPTTSQNLQTSTSILKPEVKAQLWSDIGRNLKKYGRINGKRRGLAANSLTLDELALIQADGWEIETTEHGIAIWWAPLKSLQALGLESLDD